MKELDTLMKNRLEEKIKQARQKRRKLFCLFLTFGYPSIAATERLILSARDSGVDIIELGFPFSDPLADGPTIQYSSQESLKHNPSIRDAMRLVERLRRKGCELPIVYFGYLNPVFSYGEIKFAGDAKTAGFDGLILPDLPPEEETLLRRECKRKNLCLVNLVAPTTSDERMKMLVRESQGFVYYVSLRGVTGVRRSLPSDLASRVKKIRKMTSKPVLVGFGVSTPNQAKLVARISDGVIVGSAVIREIQKGILSAERLIKRISRAVHSEPHKPL